MTKRRTGINTIAQLRDALADWPDETPVYLADGGLVVVEIQDGDSDTDAAVFLTDKTVAPPTPDSASDPLLNLTVDLTRAEFPRGNQ